MARALVGAHHRQSITLIGFAGFAAALILSWLLVPIIASAHARQVRTNPTAGALLDASPPYIQIEWSEPVSLNFSSVKVYDRERVEQPVGALGQPASQTTVIKASLPKPLRPGTYTVVWRVVSSTDGHLTAGSFAFRVKGTTGDDTPISPDTTLTSNGDSEDAGPLRWLVRAIMLGGATFLLGGALFSLWVAGPSAGKSGENAAVLKRVLRQRFAGMGAMAAGLVALALLLDLVGQVATIRKIGFLDALGDSNGAWELISTTQYGVGWLLKLGTAALLLGVMVFIWLRQSIRPLTIAPARWDLAVTASVFLSALLLVGEAISSHAAAFHEAETHSARSGHAATNTPLLSIPVLSDWAHLASVSLWVGGLGYMALVLFPGFRLAGFSADDRRAFLRKAMPRFSRLAIAGVVLLTMTGTYNLLLHSADLNTILATSYGQVVAVKIAAFIVLLVIGAANLLRVFTEEGLQRRVQWEVALSAMALVCAGGLTLLPPPVEATANTSAAAIAPVTATTTSGGYRLSLTVRPDSGGDEIQLDVERDIEAAQPLTDVLKVLFRITPLMTDAGSIAYTAVPAQSSTVGGYAWRIKEPVLTVNGAYLITCIVERTAATDIKAAFRLNLSADGLNVQPTAVPTPGP